jgi:O-succinylbenzoic acid--CoA ligase
MNQMQDWLLARKQIKPDYPALIINGEAISYYRLNWLVHESYVLIQTHIFIKPGDSVAVIMPSSISYVATIYALVRMAAIFVPLNSRQTADELRWQIENTNCSVVICSKETEAKATSLASNKVTVISFDKTTHANVETLTWINPKITEDDDNLVEEIVLSDPLAIIHTSGTSGKPKGAVLTYSNMFYSAMASAYRIGHMPDDKWLCVLPLYHVGGLSILIRAVLYGITVDLRQKFDVDEINHALTHEDITLVSLVPTMLFRLLEARKEAWSPKLRLVLVGGAATTPELVERCKSENIPIATTYGMTEASSQIATTMPEDAIRKVGTVGKPLMFTEVRVVDESGEKQQTGK